MTTNAGPGGVTNVVTQLVTGQALRFGWHTCMVSANGSALESFKARGVHHEWVDFESFKRRPLFVIRQMRQVLRRTQPDLVHSHSRLPSLVARLAGRPPTVSTVHVDQFTSHGSRWDFGLIRRHLPSWGRRVAVLDPAVKKTLTAQFSLAEHRIDVIPNGVDARRFQPPTPQQRAALKADLLHSSSQLTLAFVGALTPLKQVDWCIEGLAHLRANNLSVALLIAGNGPAANELRDLATRLGIADACTFLDWVADPAGIYHASDLLLLPSRAEGFGLVAAEAMMSGVPVLRTRTGGCSAQIIEGQTGWSVGPTDKQAFLDTLLAVCRQPDVLHQAGLNARRHAEEFLSEDRLLDAYADCYRRALAKP